MTWLVVSLALNQESTNYSPDPNPAAPCFCGLSLMGTQPRPLIYILSMVSCPKTAELVVVTEAVWHAKPKIFTI